MPLVHILQADDVWSLIAAALTLRHIGATACTCKAAARCVRQQRREWSLLHLERSCNSLDTLPTGVPPPRGSHERALSRLSDGTLIILKPSGYSSPLLRAQNLGMQDEMVNEFVRPQGVIFDDGFVYAFAACGKTVEKLRVSDGQVIGSSALVRGGAEEAALSMSAGIAIGRASNGSHSALYIVDAGLHRIVEFSTTLSWRCTFGSQGSQPGQFSYPEGCCTTRVSMSGDDRGRLFIADCFNHRVCVRPVPLTLIQPQFHQETMLTSLCAAGV